MVDEEKSPIDQLVDLFVYAPVGLLYEYPDVLPKLVKRGKSQVQLAKVMGQMATKQGPSGIDDAVGSAVETLTRGVNEFCLLLGLTPDEESESPDRPSPVVPDEVSIAPTVTPLPIAGYADLTAKQIIPLLDDLTPAQRSRIRQHEIEGRARKTILAKLDRLDA